MPNAPEVASAIEFACTALKISPKAMISATAKTEASQPCPSPFLM